jgi:sialate O-acetylesterase
VVRWGEVLARHPAERRKFEERLAAWKERAAAAKSAGNRPPRRPRPPRGPGHPHAPGSLWNAMIAPLTPLAIRGVIWYQGEANARRAEEYRILFPTMIADWRKQWRRGDFPFLFVQLANFRARKPEPADSDWAELREAQTMAFALPAVGMATAIDIGEADDIHPRNKQEVGRRLALQARAIAYGEKLVASGPRFRSMIRGGKELWIKFDGCPTGLAVRGDKLLGFQVAGRHRRWVWADAKLDPKRPGEVKVWSEAVRRPKHVRYAWADNPAATLENREGLPAEPFRTDDWPRAAPPKGR